MRKYDRIARTEGETPEAPFMEACHVMRQAANIAHNWLSIVHMQATSIVQVEIGCLRSMRLSKLKPVTHELTSESLFQLTVLPACFTDPCHRGAECRHWQLLVYSWMTPEQTERLREHLFSKMEIKNCTFFLLSAGNCEKVFSNVRTSMSQPLCAR